MNASPACDCHVHLYAADERWGATRPAVTSADLPGLRALQARTGSSRVVVVQPLLYGSDNSLMLARLREIGSGHARGVAIAAAGIDDRGLDALRAAGVMSLRFFAGSALPQAGATDDALLQMRVLAPRLQERGMHLQVNTNGRFLETSADVFAGFACPVVLDHLAHVLPKPNGQYTGLAPLLELLRDGNVWIKISGLYLDSALPHTGCGDMRAAVEAIVGGFPDRVLWGTNWPHPTVHAGAPVPDDAALLEQVRAWVPQPEVQRALMVDNAAALYRFN